MEEQYGHTNILYLFYVTFISHVLGLSRKNKMDVLIFST